MKKIIIGVILLCVGVGIGYVWFQYGASIAPALFPAAGNIAKQIEDVQSGKVDKTKFPLTLPDGFSIDVFAKDLPGARVMAMDVKGNMWVSRPDDGVITLLTVEKGRVVSQSDILHGLNKPHGLVFGIERPYDLYIAEEDKISVLKTYAETPPQKIVDLPTGGRHTTRTLFWGVDGELYVSIGSTCDVCEEKDNRNGTIMHVNLNTNVLEPYATGLRNSVFAATNPVDGALWATEMGRDNLGDNLPPDEINIIEDGGNYGWPICFGAGIHDTSFDTKQYIRDPCMDTVPPKIALPAHVAPLGLAFVPEEGWPEEYWYDLLVAFHGSWNSTDPVGYSIARIALDAQGNVERTTPFGEPDIENFISGWLDKNGKALGRPVDLLIQPGGSLYVSDDKAGIVYKVTYAGSEFMGRADDFASCASLGNPVMESFPRRCCVDNTCFVENADAIDSSQFVTVLYPASGERITSPLRFEGQARGLWFFEGSFPVRVLDANRNEIGVGIAQSQGNWMTEDFVPFEGVVEFDAKAGTEGTVTFQKDNPSGLPEYDASFDIPIMFGEPVYEAREQNGCVISGCSSHICSDSDVITDCAYKEEYVCLQKAVCKRHEDGICGWDVTRDVTACFSQFE